MTTYFQMHGLTLRSDLHVDAAEVALAPEGNVDVTIERGERRSIPHEAPPGALVADAVINDQRFYAASMSADGVVMRYPGMCEFLVSKDLSTITWHLDPSSTEDFASILLSGGVLALVLILRGELMLHASAVEVDYHALAFVGRAGMGKSTMGALVALEAGALITDDALRIELVGSSALCHRAARTVRLRDPAASLADGSDSSRTVDGRTAVSLRSSSEAPVPLRAIAVPHPDKEGRELLMERVPAAQAHLLLSRFPRLHGWEDPASGERQFQLLADLVERVPVYRLRVPWGPPFPRGLVPEILRGAGWNS